jgi:Fe-S-cluster containining protein
MSSPCSACSKRCCTHYTVSVNGYDAWVIATRLRLPLVSFLVHFPVGGDGERGFRLAPDGPRYEIALDKKGGYRHGNPCVFWIDLSNGRGRCGIYAVRPHVCQTYPAYQDGDVVLLRDDVLCPEGSWCLAGMNVPLFKRRLNAFRMEQDIYAALVTVWNDGLAAKEQPRAVEEYHAYLMSAYARLDAVRSAAPADTLRELVETWGRRSSAAPSPLVVDLDFAPTLAGLFSEIREAVGTGSTERMVLAASG